LTYGAEAWTKKGVRKLQTVEMKFLQKLMEQRRDKCGSNDFMKNFLWRLPTVWITNIYNILEAGSMSTFTQKEMAPIYGTS
jgi:hypothetical protein